MSQKLTIDGFKWVENISQLRKDFTENYNEDSDKGYFLEVDVKYPENLHGLYNDLLISPETVNIEKVEKFVANLHDKKFYAHDKFKTSTKIWISTVKGL